MYKLLKIILLSALVVSYAQSFELKTHIYIGEEIVSDLSDGKVDIHPFGSFVVDPYIVESILDNPDYFLVGTMGPDILPDFIGGQLTVHAGVEGGWVTDDWLKYLSTYTARSLDIDFIPELAPPPWDNVDSSSCLTDFVLSSKGVCTLNPLTCRAGFSNIFTGICTRNIVRNCPLGYFLDRSLNCIPDYNNSSPGLLFTKPFESTIVSKSQSSGKPYPEWSAFYRGYALHAASDIFAHTYVNNYAGDIFDLGDEDNLVVEARHKLLEMFIAEYQPLQELDVSWANSVQASEFKSRLIDDPRVANQYELSGPASYLAKMREYENEVEELAQPIQILKRAIITVIESRIERQQYFEQLIAQYEEELSENEGQVRHIQDIIDGLTEAAESAVCEILYPDNITTPANEMTQARESGLCRLRSDVDRAIIERATRRDQLSDLQDTASGFFDRHPELARIADDLGLQRLSREEAVQALVLVGAAIAFATDLDLRAIALDAAYSQYRIYIVKKAGEEYVRANLQVAASVVQKRSVFEAVQPLTDWIACYGPVYTHEIGAVVPAACEVKDALGNFLRRLKDDLADGLIDVADDTGILAVYNSYQSLQEEFERLAVRLGKDIVKGVLSDDTEEILAWLTDPNVEKSLTEAFLNSGGEAKLFIITDIVERVRADMKLDANNHFNPNEFAPIYNAIQLSKLSLLSESEINRLESLANVSEQNYQDHYMGGFNYLFSWIASLDGNHQWMPVSPKLPRSDLELDDQNKDDRIYSVNDGLISWNNTQSRDNFFEKVFKGPINVGLESPDRAGFKDLVNGAEKRNCYSSPFPEEGGEFETCIPFSAILIPILMPLLQ